MQEELTVVSGLPRSAAERLAEQNKGLIHLVMRRKFSSLLRNSSTAQDAYSYAYLYLWRAAKQYDPKRGFRFSSLACRYIEGGLLRFTERERRAARLPVVALEDIAGEQGVWEQLIAGPAYQEQQKRMDEDERWQELMERIPARLQTVLTMRYQEECTLEEIGDALGTSRQRILQLERQAESFIWVLHMDELCPRRPHK